ncbi:MAG: PilZ domain-containing protein [Proteobacteria bacterium]|nr:PilZ domain-containing protein [Pseudomonadota bacterium]
MDEKRRTARNRVLKAGTIEFHGGAIDCTIRNRSGGGAALDVASPMGIPDQFILIVPADRKRHLCHVIWRREKRIGVTFE